jgi:hypothetical protein
MCEFWLTCHWIALNDSDITSPIYRTRSFMGHLGQNFGIVTLNVPANAERTRDVEFPRPTNAAACTFTRCSIKSLRCDISNHIVVLHQVCLIYLNLANPLISVCPSFGSWLRLVFLRELRQILSQLRNMIKNSAPAPVPQPALTPTHNWPSQQPFPPQFPQGVSLPQTSSTGQRSTSNDH